MHGTLKFAVLGSGNGGRAFCGQIAHKEMIVTSNGRPIALLSSINENNLEQVLTAFRHARATNAVALLQYESSQKGTDKISMDEIDAEIEAVRLKRKK